MRRRRRLSEQREMFNPQPSLLEEQEEEVNDKFRRWIRLFRQAREQRWREIEAKADLAASGSPAKNRRLEPNPIVMKWLRARCADSDRRRAAEKEFEALTSSSGRTVN